VDQNINRKQLPRADFYIVKPANVDWIIIDIGEIVLSGGWSSHASVVMSKPVKLHIQY
jgi:hypothetical protein|tara:strand:- start:541 stop:714 length:174 start_codon:yes stop_codon:yes gene_type:complete